MAMGDPRREVIPGNIGNTSDLRQGVGLTAPIGVSGVSRPAGINVTPASTATMNAIAEWGGAAIRKEAEKNFNKSLLEGQMAHQQGIAFSELETSGDKWAIEGYHQMEAQTLLSSFLSAQKAEIANSAYALSPEEYRNQQVARLGTLLEGKDPRVQELITKQMTTQLPALVDMHMGANANYGQQRTYEAAVTAVQVVSKDDTAIQALLDIADGKGGMEGLGPNEQREALTEGIIAAFQNGNGAAYIHLKTAGKLDKLTPEQRSRIEGGKSAFQSEQRRKWSADKVKKFDEYNLRVENGGYTKADGTFVQWTPDEAMQEYAELWASYGVDISMEEGYNALTSARTGVGTRQLTTANNIETAVISQDYGAAALMAAPSLVTMESGGNYSAIGKTLGGGDFAVGKYQIMKSNIPSWTLAHLGRSMTWQEFRDSPAAQDAVFKGQFGGYIKNRVKKGASPIDAVRDAVSMWHSGRPYDVAVSAGAADINMTTKNYTDTIMANMTGTPSAEQRYNASVAGLNEARASAGMVAFEQMAPKRNELDRAFERGDIGKDEWLKSRRELYTQYGMERTKADIAEEIQRSNSVQDAAIETAKDDADRQKIEVVSAQLAAAENKMYSVYNDPNATLQEKQAAIGQYAQERGAIYGSAGIATTIEQNTGFNKELRGMWDKIVAADETATANMSAVVSAANSGTLGSSSVDAKTRTKWWDNAVATAKNAAKSAMASNPSMNEQDAAAMVQSDLVDTMAQSGYVPPEMTAMYSAALGGNLLDKNGNASPKAVSVIADYLAMRAKNPRVAATLFDSDALAVAEQIAGLAGNNVMGIASAIEQRELSGSLIKNGEMPVEILSHEGAVEEVDKVVARFFGDDTWFTRGIDAYRDQTDDPAMRSLLKAEVARVALEKYAASGAKGKPAPLVQAAADDVFNRSAILGGNLVVAPKGIDLAAETFGKGLANITGNTGEKAAMMDDPSSVDNAVRLWIYDNAGAANSNIPADAIKFWSETATPMDSALDIPGAAIIGLAKSAVSMLPTIGDERTARIANIEYEAGGFKQTAQGTVMLTHIYLPDGTVSTVQIPLNTAGDAYIRQLRKQ